MPVELITVGTGACRELRFLVDALRSEGYRCRNAPSAKQVTRLAQHAAGSAILVYNPPRQGTAREVLMALQEIHSRLPVIVIVDEGDFEEYYELMCLGAYDYFGLPEGLPVIESAVRWAMATHPQPPRVAASGS